MQKLNSEKYIPQRMCTSCRVRKPKKELMRFTKTGDKTGQKGEYVVLFDKEQKCIGRGMYLCYNTECLRKLKKMKPRSKSFLAGLSDDTFKEIEEAINLFEK